MAERYNVSPNKASPYAFWTVNNVWYNFSILRKNSQENGVISAIETKINRHDVQTITRQEIDVFANEKHLNKDKESLIATEQKIDATDRLNDEEDERIRKNVWSDIDDELYIANLIKLRTSNAVERDKRDISDSDISEEVVNSVKLDNYEMWEIEPTDLTECDCLGPPPEFLLPPPPRPPFLQTEYYNCGDDPIPDLETCDTEPVSENHSIILNNDNPYHNKLFKSFCISKSQKITLKNSSVLIFIS